MYCEFVGNATDVDDKPSEVSFGTKTNRECFPAQVPPTRFGNELNPITGSPDTGPGHYNIDEVTLLQPHRNFKILHRSPSIKYMNLYKMLVDVYKL